MERVSLVQLPASLSPDGARSDARYVLGIDGGATKTLAAVLDLQTRELHLGRAGPSNQDAVGAPAAVSALLAAADEAVARAGIEQGGARLRRAGGRGHRHPRDHQARARRAAGGVDRRQRRRRGLGCRHRRDARDRRHLRNRVERLRGRPGRALVARRRLGPHPRR